MVLKSLTSVNLISNAHPLTLYYNLFQIANFNWMLILYFWRDLLLLSTNWCNVIRYDSKGDRLIFMGTGAGPQVIDLASFNSGGENKGKKKLTSTVEKDHHWTLHDTCCFAGANDELVVAASRERDLHVWSVPAGRFDSTTIHRQMMHLTSNDLRIIGVFYNKHRATLVSCGAEKGIIKTWTSFKLPQVPTENQM